MSKTTEKYVIKNGTTNAYFHKTDKKRNKHFFTKDVNLAAMYDDVKQLEDTITNLGVGIFIVDTIFINTLK